MASMQIVLLTVELAHSHVACLPFPAGPARPAPSGLLQRLLIGAHCLVETTLRNPDIRQGDGATE